MENEKELQMFEILRQQGIVDVLIKAREEKLDGQVILDHNNGHILKRRILDCRSIKPIK